ncbi:hypothetical protein HYU50_03255 [Candidatus Woesearchaeota archaeon]|nr:hypothetical protein [Candidatus Woesearchaeota archaeon]
MERKKINRGCSAGQCFQSQEWIMEQNCGASGQICDDASKSLFLSILKITKYL